MPPRFRQHPSPAPARRCAAAHHRRRAGRGRRGYLLALTAIAAAVVVLVVGLAGPALAQTTDPALEQVIGRLRAVLVGLLVGLATLFLTVGGLRYLFAGGDPSQVEKAKVTLRSAAIGYGLAALAPALMRLLRFIVGA
jgi:Type IV secretion system pilin